MAPGACGSTENAVVIHPRAIRIGAGFDAAIFCLHGVDHRRIQRAGKRGVERLVAQGIVGLHTADGGVLLRRCCGSGGVGMQGKKHHGVIFARHLSPFRKGRILRDITARDQHRKPAPLQFFLQVLCQNVILRSFVIAFFCGMCVCVLPVTGVQYDQSFFHLFHLRNDM